MTLDAAPVALPDVGGVALPVAAPVDQAAPILSGGAPQARPIDWWNQLAPREGILAALKDKNRDALLPEMIGKQWTTPEGLSTVLEGLVKDGEPVALEFCRECAANQSN